MKFFLLLALLTASIKIVSIETGAEVPANQKALIESKINNGLNRISDTNDALQRSSAQEE